MTKKIVLGMAAVALAGAVMAPSANAACSSIRSASTYSNTGTSYWHSVSNDGTLVGQGWQLGSAGAWSTGGGAVVCENFLYFSSGGINLNLDLASCGSGCPASGGTIAILAQHQPAGTAKTHFLVATVSETFATSVNFDYGGQGDHNLIEVPRPRVVSSSRAGSLVNVSVQIPSIAGGLYGPNAASAVTGYNILSASSATNPGRNAAAYSLRTSVAAPGGVAGTSGVVGVDCTTATSDQWVVTQLTFEGGAVLSSAVSEPTRVNCNPALADPKYKIIPKKGGPKNVSDQ